MVGLGVACMEGETGGAGDEEGASSSGFQQGGPGQVALSRGTGLAAPRAWESFFLPSQCWRGLKARDMHRRTCAPSQDVPPPPASFLPNLDGSKVCSAADSPGLGPLWALALHAGGVVRGQERAWSRKTQSHPPGRMDAHLIPPELTSDTAPAPTSVPWKAWVWKAYISETQSFIWQILSIC